MRKLTIAITLAMVSGLLVAVPATANEPPVAVDDAYETPADDGSASRDVGAGQCRLWLQALEIGSCSTSQATQAP